MTKDEVIKLALDALEFISKQDDKSDFLSMTATQKMDSAIQACREALAQPEQEPVAAKKDAVFAASIEFIGALTGMAPPPIETAPPEIFQPFRDFTEKVCSIFNATAQAADSQRLEWMMRCVSGAELRRIGVHYTANCTREDIDSAIEAAHGIKD